MFFEVPSNIAFTRCRDDNTCYVFSSNMQTKIKNIQEAIQKLYKYSTNYLAANANKYHD